MKRLLTLVTFSIMLFALNAPGSSSKDKYCAELQNGKLIIVKEGKAVTEEVMFITGVRVTTDGTVIMQDGTKRALTEGECIDNEGNILTKDDMKNGKTKKAYSPD